MSHCGHTPVVKFPFSFFTLGSDSSCVAAPESSKHHAEPREKYETKRGGEEVEGLECLCDTESERETGGEQEKERKRLEPVCSFYLLISFPGGSIIDCSRGGK